MEMTSIDNSASKSEVSKVRHIGIRDMHSLLKAALLAGVPAGIIWLMVEASRYGMSFEGGMIIFTFAIVMMIVGLPLLALILGHLGRGIGTVIGNSMSARAVQRPTHVLHSKDGVRLLGSTVTQTFAIGGRRYRSEDVSHIDYLVPDVRIRMRHGPKAMEVIAVGGQQDCEEYLRGFCDLADLEF